ncbi:MAG TPA: response regulator [Terriglobales bacterium]|nr:response regulator [Terriglobales bacterium]
MAETLLYVDDNLQRLEVMNARLRLLGYKVLTASNGVDALKLFTENYVDLAVVDYYMPGMSGDLVALEMKTIRPAVPVIIFSGVFTLAEMVIAYVDGFVSTSDDPDALIRKIAEVLKPRRSARAG